MRPLGQCRPDLPAPSAARPHAAYRAEWRARLKALEPRSLLDVGCGDGALLFEMKRHGCPRCIGLDPDAMAHNALRAEGIEATIGAAEALPFANRSIDIVVLEYTAHHLADLDAGLREAARVARRAVMILEPWHDESLASQRTARDHDLWCKAIDRRLGLIHNPCPAAGDLAAPFRALGFRLDATYRLVLRDLPIAAVSRDAQAHLDRIRGDKAAEARAMAAILDRAGADGMSDDGALLFTALAP